MSNIVVDICDRRSSLVPRLCILFPFKPCGPLDICWLSGCLEICLPVCRSSFIVYRISLVVVVVIVHIPIPRCLHLRLIDANFTRHYCKNSRIPQNVHLTDASILLIDVHVGEPKTLCQHQFINMRNLESFLEQMQPSEIYNLSLTALFSS